MAETEDVTTVCTLFVSNGGRSCVNTRMLNFPEIRTDYRTNNLTLKLMFSLGSSEMVRRLRHCWMVDCVSLFFLKPQIRESEHTVSRSNHIHTGVND